MKIEELIAKKAAGKVLNRAETDFLVAGYSGDQISDQKMGKMLQVLYKQGLNEEETLNIFAASYQDVTPLTFPEGKGFKIDKHSTGGVGDSVSLVALPILAAMNFKVFKFTGGRLEFTGGTSEKLSAFPGMKVKMSSAEFAKKAATSNFLIASVGSNICNFEKKVYVLRDRYNCVGIMGLIVQSIMIKKLFLKNDGLILDVKVGSGAFFKTLEIAEQFVVLAKKVADQHQRKISFIFTDMNTPLNSSIGNELEVLSALKILEGKKAWKTEERMRKVVITMINEALLMKGINQSLTKTEQEVIKVLKSGQALKSFQTMVENQGGDFLALQKKQKVEAQYVHTITSWAEGYLDIYDCAAIGYLTNKLNLTSEQKKDYHGGITFHFQKKDGQQLKKGELIAFAYTNNSHYDTLAKLMPEFKKGIRIKSHPKAKISSPIIKIVRNFTIK